MSIEYCLQAMLHTWVVAAATCPTPGILGLPLRLPIAPACGWLPTSGTCLFLVFCLRASSGSLPSTHREGRSARDPMAWEKSSVNEVTSQPLSPDNSGGVLHTFSQRIPRGWNTSWQEPAHEWNFTGLSPFPLFPPYPPSMWFMGSISPGKLPAWVLVLGLAFEEIQDEMGGFPGGASGKELTCQCRRWKRHGFNPWVGKNPWRRAQKPTPAFLPGESHIRMSLVGYIP